MLTAATHAEWKHAIKSTALTLGGWGILKGTSTIPNPIPPSSSGSTLSAEEKKENREWQKTREKIAGAIYATLDHAHRSLIADVDDEDAKGLWDKLNAHYEKKDIGGRFFAMQNLMALTYRDLEHPTESLAEFGNRVVDGSRKLRDLLPEERKIIPATVTNATATCKTDKNHVVDIVQGTLTDANLGPGFTTSVFVDELAINVILIGLGRSEDVQQLKHSLLQTGLNSLNDVLNALQKEDTLRKVLGPCSATNAEANVCTKGKGEVLLQKA
ncbi:hypothetical protein M407DRAFT_11762 [Tulasnella calospora MUT 4182]|uniref:Uncharacterized protein n=1 Tax=Tulasnella calospora MUT 4182 TaxID=1051891 RepID=A0A0C3PUY0_9AGAM|nr:hypothetical protein M407DRAFT_11762 [Tulasnella calospora MUT 4182]